MSWWTLLNASTIVLFAVTTLYVAIRRAPAPMGPALILSQLSAFAWSLGELLAVYAPDIPSKHVALTILHAGGLMLPLSWLLLAIRFAEAHGVALGWTGTPLQRVVMLVTGGFLLLVVTNPWHGVYLEPVIHDWNQRNVGWVAAATFCYLQLFATIAVYLTLLRSGGIASGVRRQAFVLCLASTAPLVMTVAQLGTGPHPYPIDLGILGGGIGGVLILSSIYWSELFNLSPLEVSAVLAQDPTALLFFDGRGRLRFASEAADRMLDRALVDRESRLDDLPALLGAGSAESPGVGLWAELREGERELARMLRVEKVAGARWLWCDAERIEDRRGRAIGYAIRLQDVTDLQSLEAERSALVEELAATERLASLGSLAADFAHRIGEPVEAIHTEASRALDAMEARAEGPWLDKSLGLIAEHAAECGRLTRGVLDLARNPPEHALGRSSSLIASGDPPTGG